MIGEIIPLHLSAVLSSASLKRLLHKWTQCTVCCHIISRSLVELPLHCQLGRALNYFSLSLSLSQKAEESKRVWGGHEQCSRISKDTVGFLGERAAFCPARSRGVSWKRCTQRTRDTTFVTKFFLLVQEKLGDARVLSSHQPIAVKFWRRRPARS